MKLTFCINLPPMLLSKIMVLKSRNVCCVIKRYPTILWRKINWKTYLETKYPQHVKKNRIFFQQRETELIRSRICSETNPALLASKQATLSSHVVSLRTGREMKPHTTGERLVKPAAIDMAKLMSGDNVASKLQSVSLSNGTAKVALQTFHWT